MLTNSPIYAETALRGGFLFSVFVVKTGKRP